MVDGIKTLDFGVERRTGYGWCHGHDVQMIMQLSNASQNISKTTWTNAIKWMDRCMWWCLECLKYHNRCRFCYGWYLSYYMFWFFGICDCDILLLLKQVPIHPNG